METFSVLLAICARNSPVTDEFPTQRPVTRSFDVLFDLRLNKRLSKQSWGWWFETPSRPPWSHSNGLQPGTTWIVYWPTIQPLRPCKSQVHYHRRVIRLLINAGINVISRIILHNMAWVILVVGYIRNIIHSKSRKCDGFVELSQNRLPDWQNY